MDLTTKRALLDSIAYWMMRNNATEAERGDVEAEIARRLERMPQLASVADKVLQELLERSGVLRQPQHGIIDFIHRTFLEYMAARAAIDADDLGLLVDKAREDSWRETIVFAAGHARGRTRDRLIRDLLKRSFSLFNRRRIAEDVTAACCLETTAADLDADLLKKLKERAKGLFPPKDVEHARLLAPAAALDPTLLEGHTAEDAIAACIRCAAAVGGKDMLRVIETYANQPGRKVLTELLAAWTAFDEDEYGQRVIRRCSHSELADLRLASLDDDSLRCLHLLVLKEVHGRSLEDLGRALKRFVNNRHLDISYAWDDTPARSAAFSTLISRMMTSKKRSRRRSQTTTVLDAARIAAIPSLRSLDIGDYEPGVLTAISGLPNLQELDCSPLESDDLAVLANSRTLSDLTLWGWSRRSRGMTGATVDLRPLAQCPALRALNLRHFGDNVPVLLPVGAPLQRLDLTFCPPGVFDQLQHLSSLLDLRIFSNHFPRSGLDLTSHAQLRNLDLIADTASLLCLPSSLVVLRLSHLKGLLLTGSGNFQDLEDLTLSSVTPFDGLQALLDAPRLKSLHIDTSTEKNLGPILAKIRHRPGVTVHTFK
ncbi:NACHT domain-containing protein [Paramagnetospirillum magneticum]|uniref:Uncharacterized protein n=1 Tax=Paramagnetospirillum magneticum (strain ATCC 700264 / AMB-1) TaxID=342108 RepID=Q2W0Z2_PARM1|nr:hypothetical protein [Paramagnetospirillum magneticum]BAE52483.1 hypothetical protein amb3679 [Paramagnetospirillum magneticum AMB-1]